MKKGERESDEVFIRRFTRKIQQSRMLREIRGNRFLRKSKTKKELRQTAQYKQRMSKEVEHLKKMGRYNMDAVREMRKRLKKEGKL